MKQSAVPVRSGRRVALAAALGLLLMTVTARREKAQAASDAAHKVTVMIGGQSFTFRVVSPGHLKIAFTDGDLPEIGQGPDGTLVGTDGYWLTEAAKMFGLKLELFPTTFTSEILATKQGKVDIGTTAYWTAARARQVWYTYPFFQDTAGIYVKEPFAYHDPSSLKGHPVGTLEGYVYAPYMLKAFPRSDVHLYKTIIEALTALDNGQIAAYVDAYGGAVSKDVARFKDIAFKPVSVGDLGMPASVITEKAYNYVNCDNDELASALNAVMHQLVEDGSWQKALQQNGITPNTFNMPALESPPQLCKG
ncbi:MAG: substrate-binding periplasmic protein [Acetobacteraceae bacterium]